MLTACPHCKAQLDAAPEKAGQSARCPKCGTAFVISFGPPPPPPEFGKDDEVNQSPKPDAPPGIGSTPVRNDLRNAGFPSLIANRFKPAKSMFDIFDIRFQKYVTPIIISATWIGALVICALSICVLVFVLVSLWFVESHVSDVGVSSQGELALNLLAGPSKMVKVMDSLNFFLQMLALCYGLLWLRVLLEQLIVVFIVFTTFASTDRKMKT